jgi:hypothetical protein
MSVGCLARPRQLRHLLHQGKRDGWGLKCPAGRAMEPHWFGCPVCRKVVGRNGLTLVKRAGAGPNHRSGGPWDVRGLWERAQLSLGGVHLLEGVPSEPR